MAKSLTGTVGTDRTQRRRATVASATSAAPQSKITRERRSVAFNFGDPQRVRAPPPDALQTTPGGQTRPGAPGSAKPSSVQARSLPRHLEELRELGGQDGVAGHLQLAAEEERHRRLHAAVDHAAKVVVARLDRALRGAVLADHAGRRRRDQIDRPGATIGAADLEKVDRSHVLGLLGTGGENGGDFLIEERLDGRRHRNLREWIAES